MDTICSWFGISRQAHYQQLCRQKNVEDKERKILALVHSVRYHHPRMGARKLLQKMGPEMAQEGLSIGRDQFFHLLAKQDLLVAPTRNLHRTTRAGLWRYPNLLKDITITGVQQVWVGDITYLETEKGFCYLSLLTDAYSRYIVGFDLSRSLAIEGAKRALDMAIAQASLPIAGLIHHTDHGCQYTSRVYQERLNEVGILPSMGEVGNCYENALAERVNGILKLEYGLNHTFIDFEYAYLATKEAIWLYNFDRPHLALAYQIPANLHVHQVYEMV
jgi:transposase InsO family protein